MSTYLQESTLSASCTFATTCLIMDSVMKHLIRACKEVLLQCKSNTDIHRVKMNDGNAYITLSIASCFFNYSVLPGHIDDRQHVALIFNNLKSYVGFNMME